MATKKSTKKATKKATKKSLKTKTTKAKKKAKTSKASRRAPIKTAAQKTRKKTPSGTTASHRAAEILIGQTIGAVALPATGSKTVDLADFVGQKVVLYFYPKDDTPGCTLEGKDFTLLKDEFARAGAVILGVSKDPLDAHEKFKSKYEFAFDLLSDEQEEVCKKFGVIKMKNMYGKKYLGIERSTFVIDSQGKLAKEWRGVKVDGHAKEVLEFIQTLS